MRIISCDNLDEAILHYTTRLGYRLNMIFPADSPTAAIVSKDGESVRLVLENHPAAKAAPRSSRKEGSLWIKGRAGMEYRDLMPDRLGGKVIASHIRLANGGEVPDYVHYHKVKFQMIYCKRGRIRVVYEDQGPPFWLETGDCVVQPPEIRHRVLECTAGAEVIEIGMPAVHETWVEHDITLPTAVVKPERDFSGQRFVRHIAAEATWKTSEVAGFEACDTGISAATKTLADVRVLRPAHAASQAVDSFRKHGGEFLFYFVLDGTLEFSFNRQETSRLRSGESIVIPSGMEFSFHLEPGLKLLEVSLPTPVLVA